MPYHLICSGCSAGVDIEILNDKEQELQPRVCPFCGSARIETQEIEYMATGEDEDEPELDEDDPELDEDD